MSDVATRKDIDEVLHILRDFMKQVDDRFQHIEERLDKLDEKYDHLVSAIDGFIARLIDTRQN